MHTHRILQTHFHYICGDLITIRANNYQLGIGLGLPPGELQLSCTSSILTEYCTGILILKCCYIVWLRQCYSVEMYGRPTWQTHPYWISHQCQYHTSNVGD